MRMRDIVLLRMRGMFGGRRISYVGEDDAL